MNEFYQVNMSESPSFGVNFKKIIFSDIIKEKSDSKENRNHLNGFLQKQSKLLLNNKEVKSKIYFSNRINRGERNSS